MAAIVLAAGLSRRMGDANKLLASLGGRPVVRHAVEAALAAGLDPVVVVTGHQSEQVLAALEGLPIRAVRNPDAHMGISTSIAAGVRAVGPVEALAILLGDMPWVAPTDIVSLVAAFAPEKHHSICVPVAAGRRGNPVLWGARYFEELSRLEGDAGARALLDRYPDEVCAVPVEGTGVLRDVDVPADLSENSA